MKKHDYLAELLQAELTGSLLSIETAYDEVTAECEASALIDVLQQLRDHEAFAFDELIDLCAVDYLLYGEYDWETESATE